MAKYQNAFSEYEIKNSSIKFEDAETFEKIGCVGSLEEELEVKVVTKNCEGVQVKSVARGATNGTLNVNLHMRYDLYVQAFGMALDGFKEGVYAYGKNSKHKEFIFVAEVYDEDGNKKLIAYPRCVMASAPSGNITNGAEEVAEIELEINVFADDDGNVKYEAMVSELSADITEQWMSGWSVDLIQGN